MLAISQDAEGLSTPWERMLGASRSLRGFVKTHIFLDAVIPSGVNQQVLGRWPLALSPSIS